MWPSEAFIHLSKNKIKINLSYVQKTKIKTTLLFKYEVGKKKRGRRDRILPLFSFLQKPLQWFPSSYWQICSTNQQQMLPLSVYNHWHVKRLKNIPTQICTGSSKKNNNKHKPPSRLSRSFCWWSVLGSATDSTTVLENPFSASFKMFSACIIFFLKKIINNLTREINKKQLVGIY